MAPNSSSSSAKKHDVFLSFRGEDTRTNFTGHLYNALSRKSIRTYIDYQLNRGDDVWPALERAIEESEVSVVVFSENYASSKWCLEELVKILECREKQCQVVIPVFYEVDPSHIRKQTGSFEKAFAKHERDVGGNNAKSNAQKVLRWKAALTQAANISGWDSRTHRDESKVIENIVNDVLEKLQLRYPTGLKDRVTREKNCQKVELLLKKVRVLGIWGMGGIGKSTIAKVLFAKLFPQYDNVCFVANARECSLDKLFFDLFKEEVPTSNVVGSSFDMRRLNSKKVFIVLDDINSLDPLEYLCREYGELDHDSRLIVTTRDRQLLVGRVEWIYKVKKWNSPESLKLFCSEAFRKGHPQKGYESLSESAVNYAGGVPLALKILGSYLHSKDYEFWNSTFRKLDKYPNEKIQNVLKVSYNGLDETERNVFLDIAFFFEGEKRDHVVRILDACGFEATAGVQVLEDKALITISTSSIIQMHDLLQKMGLDIVRQECGGDPGKRSRLKDNEAREVIEENKGSDAIQGIALDLSQINDLPLHADTFTKMKTLRYLKFYNSLGQSPSNTYLNLPTILEPFSDKLRYIEWIGYPFEYLPSPFYAKFLVEIRMPFSKVKLLWQGLQQLDKLAGIDLSECKQFEALPDLSKAPRLKWVNLSGCESLQYLHPSVLSSDSLATLILDRCTKLKSVKGKKHLKSLERISVNGCLSLEEFAVSSDLIENLDLSNTGLKTLDKSIGLLHNLKWLNLEGLKLNLLNELSGLKSLKELKLSDRGLVIDEHQLRDLFDGLRSLQVLYLKDCIKLFELPDNISVLSQLQELRLDGSNVKSLPESIKNLQELEILSLENCKELLCLPELPPLIKQLCAINCKSLASVSNLKTLATKMLGMTKRITFKNSLKLEGFSLKLIIESLHLTMMSAVFHNVLVRRLRVEVHSYNYTSIELCLPGSKVPRQIKYRSAKSSITIELPNRSNLLGFIYSVVLSPAGGMKKEGTKIKCKCHLQEGIKATWLYSDVYGLNSDHVYVWYDPFHCDSILRYYEPKVCFEFCVENDEGEADGSICIKECGIRLVRVSEVHSVLQELDLDYDKKKDLEKGVELESGQSITFTSIESSNEESDHGVQSQQGSSSELSSSDSIVELDSEMVEPDSSEEGNGRKNHYSDVEESIKSTHKETKTRPGREYMQDTREFTKEVTYIGNKGRPIIPDARLQETVESHSDKESGSEEKSTRMAPMLSRREMARILAEEKKLAEERQAAADRSTPGDRPSGGGPEAKPPSPRASVDPSAGCSSSRPSSSVHQKGKDKSSREGRGQKRKERLGSSRRSGGRDSASSSEDRPPLLPADRSLGRFNLLSNFPGPPESHPMSVWSSKFNSREVVDNHLTFPADMERYDRVSPAELLRAPKSVMDELESFEEDQGRNEHFSDVEESIGYTHKEIKTGPRSWERIREYAEDVKNKENERRPAEPDATSHDPIELQLNNEYYVPEYQSITQSNLVVMVELESAKVDNADYFSDVGESIKSTTQENNTTARSVCKEKLTEFTEVLKSEGTLPEHNVRLHEPIRSHADKENASEDKSKPKSMLVEPESAKEDDGNKDHFSNVEESIKFTHKETKTNAREGCTENKTKSRKIVKCKENEGKSNIGLHLPMVSVDEENITKDKSTEISSGQPYNIEKAKHSDKNKNIQGVQIIDDPDIYDLNNVREPSLEKENKEMNSSKAEGEDVSDEDPFAELDSILLGSQKSSAKATSSTVTTNFAVREALHDLQYLLENSLESILNNNELKQQVHTTLEFIKQSSEENVSPHLATFVESMASSVDDLFKDFALTQKVVEVHTSHLQQREKIVQEVRDAKILQDLVNKEISQCKFKTERLDKEAKRLDEKIRLFVEQKGNVESKRDKLKETLEKCDEEKKKLKNEAKNKVAESKEIMLAIDNSKSSYEAALSKQHKLNDKWEGFRTAFADNCETPVVHESWWHKPELLILLLFIFNIFLCYKGSEVNLQPK